MKNFQDYLTESMVYKTGDHVHQHFQGNTGLTNRGSHNPADYKHGEVVHHSSSMVKVKWEDGSHTTHKQSDGMERGKQGYDSHNAISHNKTHIPNTPRMTNDEHKKHLARVHAKDSQ